MRRADVIVVGGGPAGAATAWALARAGVDVLVLDRARFPRAKPCAECLSVEGTRILGEMGVLDELVARGAVDLRGMRIRSPEGTTFTGTLREVRGFRPHRSRSIAVRREVLDAVLLDAARAAGARVETLTRVADVMRDDRGRVTGVRVEGIHDDHAYGADVVIGADGLRSVVARRLRLTTTSRTPRRIALVARWRGVRGLDDFGEMHVERGGFVGIADVGGGEATVAMVVPARRGREIAGDRAGFMDAWVRGRPQLAARFATAERVTPVTATGPFATGSRRAWAPGAALVGDAADFFDPFTGEGMYAALRGAELLAPRVLEALGAETPAGADAALAAYDADRRAEFSGKWRIERLIAATVATPWLMNRAARVLAARPEMADLLLGATGHYVPPREVLNPRFVLSLFGPSVRA